MIGDLFLLQACQILRRRRVIEKKRYIRHRSLDFASSIMFYSDSIQRFLSMTEGNRNKSISDRSTTFHLKLMLPIFFTYMKLSLTRNSLNQLKQNNSKEFTYESEAS